MRLTLLLTGTVIREGEVFGDGKLVGDPDDPIRPIDIDLGNVSWTMVSLNIEEGTMVIEVLPAMKVTEPTGEIDPETQEPIMRFRETTPQEKASLLQNAQHIIESRTEDELYAMAKCPKLKRPFKTL